MADPGPVVLALDTATVVNVGLARGGAVLARASVTDRMAHVEQLVPLLAHCLDTAGIERAELDLVVVGLGPGPFTGLRVGVVTAQLLAATLRIGVRGVCSLDVIAADHAAIPPEGDFVVATDARRREVYWARYSADGVRVGPPQVSAPAELPELPVVGPAADLYAGVLRAAPGPRALEPGVMAVRGPRLPDLGREPLYLRRPDATEPGRRKSVLHVPRGAR